MLGISQAAFEFLKESLTAYPDTKFLNNLYTDASANCIGAFLSQEQEDIDEHGNGKREIVEKSIYFLSDKLSLLTVGTQLLKGNFMHYKSYILTYTMQSLSLRSSVNTNL